MECIQYLENTHVLNPNEVHKLSQLYLVLELYKKYDPKCFQCNLHVSPSTFDALLQHICDYWIFQSQTQAQFLFGHFGNSMSVDMITHWVGVSAGMVVKATRHVMVAFMALHDQQDAKDWVEAASCMAWRNGWIFVDGTLHITLPNLKIVDYVIGHCGSCHDSMAFLDSPIYSESTYLENHGEWICADSAYPVEVWCVTPYKKPASNIHENANFNY
ncbi:hypothetical protein L218DRAFT_974149 [Marasmius fiardii PR-910]|nr:hypothetical protein L218DRAFT_974149 [Marasmius fiardii PR-910]